MRHIAPGVVVAFVSLLGIHSSAQQYLPVPEARQDVPSDQCRIELSLPAHAKVTVDNRDFGEQRSIALRLAEGSGGGQGERGFLLVVDFPNGGRLSQWVAARGGTVVRVALSTPPIETVLLEGPSAEITSLAFSPDGKWIATGTDEEQVLLWDTETGRIRWNGDAPVSNASSDAISVAFSPDGSQVLVGGQNSGVALLETATGKRLRDLSGDSCELETDGANGVAFSPSGQQVAAALSFQDEPIAVIWNLASGKRVHTLRRAKRPADNARHEFSCLAFSPNGRHIVCGSSEEMAVLFDAATGDFLREFPSGSGSVLSVAMSPDGSTILAGTTETKAVLWDVATGNLVRTYDCATDDYVHSIWSVGFSPDGRQILASSGERTLLFDVNGGATLRTFNSSDDETYAVAFSPDGHYVLTSGTRDWGADREVVLWEMASGKHLRDFRGPRDVVRSMAFSADGQRLTVRYRQGRATVWDMNTGQPIDRTCASQAEEVVIDQDGDRDRCTSPDGRWSLSHNANKAIVFTDTRTAKMTTNPGFQVPAPIRAAFSPVSPRIAIEKEDAVHVFNPQTGRELASLISAYDGRDWLITTPDGYCDGTPGGRSLIRWRVGEAEYPSERFEKQLHRPDMVAKILQGMTPD
jgi:WD40 repeat protein